MVHSVCLVLARRAVRASDISLRLAADFAAANFRHCCSRGFEFDQRDVLPPSETASRTARYLRRRSISMDYFRINHQFSR